MLIAVKYMHHFALRDHLLSRKFSGNKGKVTERILSIGSNASFVVGKIKNSENLRPPLSLNY